PRTTLGGPQQRTGNDVSVHASNHEVLKTQEQQRCLTQTPPSSSSTTIQTSSPPLGVCCDRSAWKPSYLRPFPIFSSPIRRMAPPAWYSTSDCRGRAVLICSESSLRRRRSSQSSSSQGTATFRCRCKR